MLADEITTELRAIRAAARISAARSRGVSRSRARLSQGHRLRLDHARSRRHRRHSAVEGVDPDLRVRPFFAHGGTISIREFVVGASTPRWGCRRSTRPGGAPARQRVRDAVRHGARRPLDPIEAPPAADAADDPDGDGVGNEIPQRSSTSWSSTCSTTSSRAIPAPQPGADRADLLDADRLRLLPRPEPDDRSRPPRRRRRDRLRSRARHLQPPVRHRGTLLERVDDGSGIRRQEPDRKPFVVQNIFTDFKRHDLGPNFHERNYDGTLAERVPDRAALGVGSTAPYGHDGRSINLDGGDPAARRRGPEARDAFAPLGKNEQSVLEFPQSLVLFPPDDTASNLDPGDRAAPSIPIRSRQHQADGPLQ